MYGTVAIMVYVIVATCSFSACSKDDGTQPFVSPYAENRTVMVYMVAENSLNKNVAGDIQEMLAGMDNDTLFVGDRLVIYIDDLKMPRIYVVDKNTKKTSLSDLTPVKEYVEDVNSSSAEQLRSFVDYVKNQYPADSYGLVLWSHSSGWVPSGFSDDESYEAFSRRKTFGVDNGRNAKNNDFGYQMEIPDMAAALEAALEGRKLDFIFFDACVMQNIEVAYELRHVAKSLIASPAEIPAPGANYKTMVRAMFRSNSYVDKMLEVYEHEYNKSAYGLVISAINTSTMDDYATYMKSLVTAHRSEMMALNTSSMLNYIHYGEWTSNYPDFLDMQGIMLKVLDDEEYVQWKAATDKMVTCLHVGHWYTGYIKKSMQIDDAQCCGVSMFIPFAKYNSTSFNTDYYTTSWAKAVWKE